MRHVESKYIQKKFDDFEDSIRKEQNSEVKLLLRAAFYLQYGKCPAGMGEGTFYKVTTSCGAIESAGEFPYGDGEFGRIMRERYAQFYDFDSRVRIFHPKEYGDNRSKAVREQRIMMVLLYAEHLRSESK